MRKCCNHIINSNIKKSLVKFLSVQILFILQNVQITCVIHIHMYSQTYMWTHVPIYLHTHVHSIHILAHIQIDTHTHIDTSTSTQTHTHAQIQTTLSSQNTQRNNLLFLSYHSLYTKIHANSPKSEFCKTFFFYAFLLLIFLYTQWVGIFSLSLGYVISVRQ